MESQSEEVVAPPDPNEEDSWEHSAIPQLQTLTIKETPPPASDSQDKT
jgi:hypothetical protein